MGLVFYAVYFTQVVNPRVVTELRSNPSGERAKQVMVLTFPDGKVLPVNYLRETGLIYVGADFAWWKKFVGDGAAVEMLVQGHLLSGRAQVILDDSKYTKSIFSRLRPSTPKWLPTWLNGKLVVITLDTS
jgi:hypothetical protein